MLLVTVITFSNCGSSAEKVDNAKTNVDDAKQNLDQAKEDYDKEYAKFKLESDHRIEKNNQQIENLRITAKDMKKEARLEYERTIADLEARNLELKKKLDAYSEEGNEKWESFKREFNEDMNNLGQAFENIGKDNVK